MTYERQLHLTLCNGVKTHTVKHVGEPWDAVVARMSAPPAVTTNRESLKWPLFVPFKMLTAEQGALMRENKYGKAYSRCTANVEFADLLCLDIDNDPDKLDGADPFTIQAAREAFAGLAYVLYSSFNHRNPAKQNVDKFRVVLPLAVPVTYQELTSRKAELTKLFPFIDPSSLSISQPFYVPMAHPDRVTRHETYNGQGEWFDLFALEETQPQESKNSTQKYIETGETHADLPVIKIKTGVSYRADQLYETLEEGYNNRVACFRIDGPDTKPGCFVYRRGSGLFYFDHRVAKQRFIKIKKVIRADAVNPFEHEEDVATTPLWQRKHTVAKASEKVNSADPPLQATSPRPSSGGVSESRTPIVSYIQHQPKILQLNCRYLPDDLLYEIPSVGVAVIRSPKGTGKTELMKRLTDAAAKKGESVMLLGHRIFLLKNLAGRTNLDHYLDLADGATTPSMAICMNSLTRINPHEDEPYDTIIIDESEQVFQALVSNTMRYDLSVIFNNLLWLFYNAKRILCLDADLSSELTIQLIDDLRGNKASDAVLGVKNNFQIGAGKTTKLYEKRMHLLAEALSAIEQGEKVFITCNSRKFATTLDTIIKTMGKRSLLVTADTNELPETTAFVLEPQDQSRLYDAVVSSPTLSTGVSIEGDHFTKVYGFFQIKPGTYQDIDQALSRVRACDDVSVWIQGNEKQPFIPKEEDIFHAALDKERNTLKRLWQEQQAMTKGQRLWAYVFARITHMLNLWSVNKDQQFSQLRRELGFRIQSVLEDEEASKKGALIYGQFRNSGGRYAETIFTAADIDSDEEAELERKPRRTKTENLSLEKARLRAYLKDEWSLEIVEQAIKQDLLRTLGRIRNLHAFPVESLKQDDIDDRLRNENTFTANRHRMMRRELIDSLCKAANIDVDELYDRIQTDDEVEISRESMLAVAKTYAERKRDFNTYFDCRIKDPTDEKTVKKVWNVTLGAHLALDVVRKKRGPKANRIYRYFLNPARKDLVHRVKGKSAFF